MAAAAVLLVPDGDNLAKPPGVGAASRPPRDFQRTSMRVPIGTSTVGSGALGGEGVGGAAGPSSSKAGVGAGDVDGGGGRGWLGRLGGMRLRVFLLVLGEELLEERGAQRWR